MNKFFTRRIIAMLLAVLLVAGLVPAAALAAETGDTAEETKQITVATTKESALAPGVTETAVVAYDANGDRIQYFVVNANISTTDTVQVKANYQNNDNTGVWGKATVIEQANAATEKRGYNVVATTNASYYNVSTGQPSGGFVMEGVNINGNGAGDSYPFFAILDDGTAMIGQKGTFSQYADRIQEAVGGWTMLVWDGKNVATDNSKYPRSTVGIKANGDVVLMVADGNQKPTSAGLTKVEQAEVMLSLGCVAAIELDGGGSATYAAKLEGTDEVVLRNTPCDGTIRSVSNSLMVISTAVADGTFDHVNLSTEYPYYAPNSVVAIEAMGADAAGGAAEIPEGLNWVLSDDSFGTVADGVFTSTGKTGTVTVQVMNGEKQVGSIDVTLVNPTSIAFSAAEKTVPYGKTSDFSITAMYNGAEVYAAADAYTFEASVGTMNGFVYMAPNDESIAEATVEATYKYAALEPIVVKVIFGKGSEILFDFENADISEWADYEGLVAASNAGTYTGGYSNLTIAGPTGNPIEPGMKDNIFLASKSNGGKAYSGEYSLGFTIDYTQHQSHANWLYDYLFYLGDTITYRDVDQGINGTRLGMWMYIPEEAVGLCARLAYTYETATGTLNTAYLYFTYQYVEKGFSKLTSEKIPEAGWAYVYCDLDAISTTYVATSYYKDAEGNLTREEKSNYAPAFIQFIVSSSATGAEKCTVYIDDITLDYSDVVDDRDAPLITNPVALDDQNTYSMGSTLSFNSVSFTADVAEDTSHGTNYTGLDATTAQIYVDGQKVATSYSAGKISATGVVLPNGTHDVTFEIADKQGNYTKLTKQITIAAETEYAKLWLEGAAPGVNQDGNLYTGSQYDLLLKTDKVEAIDTVTTTIWLNSASKWALEHQSTLYGFETTYTVDELACTATITVTRTGAVEATGEATLVTIPVYGWFWDGSAGFSATEQWNSKNGGQGCAPQIDVSYDVKFGNVAYTADYAVADAGYVAGFGAARVDVETELNTSIANLKKTIGEWHYHTEGEACDLAATCFTDGYTGRTFCTVCHSVINWGTTVKAEGHDYQLVNGVLQCVGCGKLVNGYYEGVYYIDGILANGWVDDTYYYVDGIALTGAHYIDGALCVFGEDGVYDADAVYSGLAWDGEDLYYLVLNEKKSGWIYEDGAYYYFDPVTFKALDGVQTIGSYTSEFENFKLIRGQWVENSTGLRYWWAGEFVYREWKVIDEKTYHFDEYGYADTGLTTIAVTTYGGEFKLYLFDEKGALRDDLNGLTDYEGDTYYLEKGVCLYAGLVCVDGDYYYIAHDYKAIKNETHWISKTNDLLEAGNYVFDADGKIVFEAELKNGVYVEEDGVYYYKEGNLYRAGLVLHEGSYYYFNSSGKAVTGTYWVSLTNGLMEEGSYEFAADGKMIIEQEPEEPDVPAEPEVKNGVYVEEDGVYYYKDGKLHRAGLVLHEGSYYYFNSSGKAVTGTYWVSLTNGLMEEGSYEFAADGKMIIEQEPEEPDVPAEPEVKNGVYEEADGVYYYKDGKLHRAGLVLHEGSYYYFNSSGKAVTGWYWVSLTNGLMEAGSYEFGADGKMIIEQEPEEPVVKNGVYVEEDGVYYYKDGKLHRAGLVLHEGSYYYFNSTGKAVTGIYWVSLTNGLMEEGSYEFGADGKMVQDGTTEAKNGVYEEADGLYYYKDGKLHRAGLVLHEGSYYYFNSSGKAVTGWYWVSLTNGLVEPGSYNFGTDGKMILE